jgi:hypothetical protein
VIKYLQYLNNSLPLPSLKNGKMGKKREKNIFFSKYLPDNKKGVLLHPLIERMAKKQVKKVLRHIELTAVLT